MTPTVLERMRGNLFWRQVTVLMTGTALAQVVPMLAAPVLSRLYTDTQRGEYAIFMALVGGLMTIAALRYDFAIVLPESDADARGLMKASFRLAAGMSALFVAVLLVFAGPLGRWVQLSHLRSWAPLVGLVGFAYACVTILNFWCNRRQQFSLMSSNKMVNAVGTSGSAIGFGAGGAGSIGLVASQLVGQGLGAATLAWRTRRDRRGPSSPIGPLLREYRRMPLLNGPNALVDSVRLNGIPLLIAAGFGTAVTGQFNYAWTLTQVPVGIANASLGQVFYQRLARTQPGQMYSLVSRSMVRLALVAVVPFALVWWLSPWLFPILLGPGWEQAGLFARVLVPWLAMNFITAPISMLFLVTRRQGTMLAFAVVYAAVPLSLLYWRADDPVTTLARVGWAMGALLVVNLGLALQAARQFDRQGRPEDPEGQALAGEGEPTVEQS